MNSIEEVTNRIPGWLVQTFPLAQQQDVGIHDSLLDSGIIDSLGTLEVVQFLEEEFSVEVTDEEMVADHFESVHAIAQLVASKAPDHNEGAKVN